MASLAVYTTIYPGVERFLSDWYRSLRGQTDQDFQLWIGLDSLTAAAAEQAMGGRPEAIWVSGESGDTPAQVRQRAWEQMVRHHEGVVLVDSDDVLHPTRVAAARRALSSSDVAGCALRLVDERNRNLDLVMQLPEGTAPADILPRHNLYGLSNSAYRCDVLAQCLSIPADVVHVDWFIATRAWLNDAAFGFDPVVRMDYRQHGANMAYNRGPFSPERVEADTAAVQRHFKILRVAPPQAAVPERLALLEQVAADIDAFHQRVVTDPERLSRYVHELNALPLLPIWWSHIAHASLRFLWTNPKEPE